MIIDRYVLRELVLGFLAVGAVLLAVFVSFTLTRLLADAGAGLLTAQEVRQLAFLKALIALEVLLPIALYVAVLLCFGRLHQDAEFHAFAAAGVSEARLLRPVLGFALLLALVVGVLSTQARPWSWERIYALKHEAENASDVDRVDAGEFHQFGESERTLFIGALSADRERLRDLFVHDARDGALQVIAAPRGRFHAYAGPDRHELELEEADVYRRGSGGGSVSGHFREFRLSFRASGRHPAEFKEKSRSTTELASTANPSGRAEWQWRYSTPASTLLLALIAVPLARSAPRRSRYGRLIGALILYALYYNLLGLARGAVEHGDAGSLWWVPALLGVAVAGVHGWPLWRARARP